MNSRRILALAIAALFLSGAAFAQIGFNQDERMMIQKLKASNGKLEQGEALFAKGNFDKAEKKFRECLNIFPKNANANYFLAQILLKKNDLEKALQSIETAETCFSELSKLYSFTHQEMLNKLREQKQDLEESIRRQEEDLSALMSRPRSEQTQASISSAQGAVNQYLETIKRDPSHEFAYNNLASIYFMAKQYDTALGFLQQAEANGVKVNPQFKKDLEDRLGKKNEAESF